MDVFMQTNSGKKLFLQHPSEDDIDISDIAHGLSNVCRFAGQCEKFYSVAEHCILVATQCDCVESSIAALLHDASEAYIGDITSPLKSILPTYRKIEKDLTNVIIKRFRLSTDYDNQIKEIDLKMLSTERDVVFKNRVLWGSKMDSIKSYKGITFNFWSPKEAEERFLRMFNCLIDERSKTASIPIPTE